MPTRDSSNDCDSSIHYPRAALGREVVVGVVVVVVEGAALGRRHRLPHHLEENVLNRVAPILGDFFKLKSRFLKIEVCHEIWIKVKMSNEYCQIWFRFSNITRVIVK